LQELASARDLAREECELYERALLELEGEGDGGDDGASPGGMADLDQRLRTAEEEESVLMKRIATIQAERASIKEEMAELQTRYHAPHHATCFHDDAMSPAF
jgi:chromosome segregation ATPase